MCYITPKINEKVFISSTERKTELKFIVFSLSASPTTLSITDNWSKREYRDADSVTMLSGEIHNLTCSVPRARPPAILEWQNGDEVQLLQDDQYNSVEGEAYVSRRVASVIPSRDNQGKVLRCVGSHRELINVLYSSILLDVQGIFIFMVS